MHRTVSKQLKYIRSLFMIGFVLWACSVSALAKQTVVLVTGEKMVVDQARVESERVWISWNGLTLSIDKKDVIRIEGSGKKHIIVHETPTEVEEERYQKPPQKPAPKPAANRQPTGKKVDQNKKLKRRRVAKTTDAIPQNNINRQDTGQPPSPDSNVEVAAFLQPNGFGDLKWGDHLTTQIGFRKLEENSELPDVFEYIRQNEQIQAGPNSKEAVVKYAFWRNRLYMVTLWADGPEAYESIRDAMIKHFGPGIQSPEKKQAYYWIDDNADRMIDYLEDKELGMLWMRSREINHQYKLAQMRIPIGAGRSRSAGSGKK